MKGLHNISEAYPMLNHFFVFISTNDFLKGGIVVSLLWFFWFQGDKNINEKRRQIICTLVSCLIAIAIGRLLARVLIFRERPVLNENYASFFPNKHIADGLYLNSSMPSDHAVMFCALATGIFLISKKIGILAYIYISCFVLFPRVYLGYHYATDIITGAAIGISITLIYSFIKISDDISSRVMQFSIRYKGLFYLLFFWLSFQIGTMFDSSRMIAHYIGILILHSV